MLILDYPEWSQHTIMNVLIPAEIYRLSPELGSADKMLEDGSLEAPILSKFRMRHGRPTVPIRVYLRLMFLKHHLGTSYQGVVSEVTHNLMYRNFCHIPLERRIPNKSTLMKTTARYGRETITALTHDLTDRLKGAIQTKGR